MKQLFFAILAGLTLASCSEISTDPAPARVTRTAQTVTVTYNLTSSTIASDTLLQGAQIDVYTLKPTTNADGTLTYPAITASTAPVFTTTAITTTAQTFTVATGLTVAENTPNLGIRVVLRSSNRPGRRTNSQRLTAAVVINGTSRATFNHQGTNFSRTAAVPSVGYFSTTGDANVAGYVY
ncbi:hypothetical protein Q5H92_10145 [Hymenobacter sp. M29]|uniref:DUF1735 domain-containing protein n=1 Tax=Hymenobacter mellowenesis TaxID=3063995 RepID=A0ABT9AA57_9BACT|nr:hypothetical protein [Hymenobacter sp. M29]MDO7846717.1 hypothetical protein [Hymenobacter sp. M29]